MSARGSRYTVRIRCGPAREMFDWCRARGLEPVVYETLDGGGFNGFLFEFEALRDVAAFVRGAGFCGDARITVETADGRRWRVDAPTPACPPDGGDD